MENRVVTFSKLVQFRYSESGKLWLMGCNCVSRGIFLGVDQTHQKSLNNCLPHNLRDLALLFGVWRWLDIIWKKWGAMSETFSQAAKRLLVRLDARGKLVRLPMTPAGRALLRRNLAQEESGQEENGQWGSAQTKSGKIVLSGRNFDREAANNFPLKINCFNLKTSEH